MCFTAGFLFSLIIQLIVICGIISIFAVLLPWAVSLMGAASGVVIQVIKIILGVILAIAVVYLIWDLWVCLFANGRLVIH